MNTTPNDQGHENYRLEAGIIRGPQIEVTVNGRKLLAYAGETIGAALAAAGVRKIRRAAHLHDPRGLYCGMGTCHGCLVTVNGQPNVRACVTPLEPGQQIELQDGLGRVDLEFAAPFPGRLIQRETAIVIIGGGPAGLSAAVAAARVGAQVLVIEENLQPGGQIYRQLPRDFQVNAPAILGSDYADGQTLLKQAEDLSDRITIWNNALVWSVFDSKRLAVAHNNNLVLLDAHAIVVATGAYERPVPVPGWTLPGVMTVGGAQVLLKSQRIRPGNRILLAGTGPLQLVVASQMLAAGIKVVAVSEAASFGRPWRWAPDLMHQPGLLGKGLGFLYQLKRAGVPVLYRHVLKLVDGDGQVQRAVLGKVDGRCRPVAGRSRSLEVDTVCIGYGLIPASWLTRMLGCRHIFNPMSAAWQPYFDTTMQTDRNGVFVAGDGAGIAGVLVARQQGRIAGLFAAVHAGIISSQRAHMAARPVLKRLKSLQKFRRAMDRIYNIYPDLYANATDETIICRCEAVTAGSIRRAIREGTTDLNDIKKRTRAGMGFCQGTNCLPAIAAILTREFGVKAEDIKPMTTRPPARPIALNLLRAAAQCDVELG